MELFINDTPIGITPNDGDTIQHLLNAVTQELEEDLIIAVMVIDGKYCSVDDPAVLQTPVANIQKVELTVATRVEICVSLLEDGKQFIIIGAQELKNGSFSKKAEILNSFAWILESLDALKGSLPFPPTDITILRAIITEVIKRLDSGDITIDEAKEIGDQLEKVVDIFEVLKLKLLDEHSHSKDSVLGQLRNILPLLPEIATNFQVGQDLHAIQDLCKIIDNIEMFTRLAAIHPEDDALQQQALNLKDISLQMLHAFENKDFILIADLIEYDLSENIEEILENE